MDLSMENSQKQKMWFRAKRYGFGWTPSTWEGWLVMLFYILLAVLGANRIVSMADDSGVVGMSIALFMIPLTVVLILVCYIKGEKPRWRWGEKK